MSNSSFKLLLKIFILIYSIALAFLFYFAGNLAYIIKQAPDLDTFTAAKQNNVSLDKLPSYISSAFLAAEDIRYFARPGMETRAILKSLIRAGIGKVEVPQEITVVQKLVKYAFKAPAKSFPQKLQEAYLAFVIENTMNRKQILQMYVNHAYFGSQAYGLTAASYRYFKKAPPKLSISEVALLAGIVNNPDEFSPFTSPRKAFSARNAILATMASSGFLTKDVLRTAQNESFIFSNTEADSQKSVQAKTH